MSPSLRHEYPYHRGGRRGSNASSIHSVGGQLDTGIGSSHLFELGQNAISTLLQAPIVRTGLLPHSAAPASSAHRPPTARDIPPVTLTNVNKVDAAEFTPYLTQVGALHEQLRRIRESDDDGSDQVFRRSSRIDEFAADDGHLRPRGRQLGSRKSSSTSLKSTASAEPPQMRRRSSSGLKGSKVAHGPPPLSTIPNVYFDQDFHLENPRTFDVVSERSEVVQQAPGATASAPRKALATNAILQEKLSWYMDTVEMHLITSISTASTTFFTALGSLRELHSEAADSVERIQTLRKELDALDQHIATSGLDIVQKKRRRENLQQLNDAVQQLQEILNFVGVCEAQVDAGELEDALESIDTLDMLIAGRRKTTSKSDQSAIELRDLRGAVALKGISDDIAILKTRVGRAYEAKFVAILLDDVRRHVETVSRQEVLLRWSGAAMRARGRHSREPSAFPAYLGGIDGIREELKPVLAGLQQSGYVTPAITAYGELILKEIRNLVRKPLPSSNDDDNESMMSVSTVGSRRMTQQEKSSILARNLRALDHEDAEDLFITIYVSVTETLRRLSTQVKVLFDVAGSIGEEPDIGSGMRSPSGLKSPPLNSANRDLQEDIHLAMDMANLMGQAVDLGQEKILKVLRVRSEQTTHLPLVWFLRYFTLNFYFANECESISGRSGTPLKTTVNQHIKDFIQHHGDSEKQKLAQAMESDQWSAKDFTDKDNELLVQILQSSTSDAPEWSEASKIWAPHTTEEDETQAKPESETNGSSKEKEKTRSAIIDEEPYILPNSAILCLQGISQFLHLIATMPSMASEVSTSLIGYLQLFNSRCTQLILGAGATRSAGLKNITTRHLALAAQALAFISALIPHVREFVRRHAGGGPSSSNPGAAALMGEFDKVRRLFQEHQNNIYEKLVEIMSGRAATHAKAMKNVDWDNNSAAGAGVNGYMETLVKDTVTLYKVLSKHLPKGTILMIMPPVFDSYKSHLSRTLENLKPTTEQGVQRMENDVGFLSEKLGKIEGYGDVGDKLLAITKIKRADIVSAKGVEEARRAAEAKKAQDAAAEASRASAEATKAAEAAEQPNGTSKDEGITKAEDKVGGGAQSGDESGRQEGSKGGK
ncbi:Vps54-like protein-domain-containing protein [Microdochium bolleyi]|uniref:Vacuolar protein sorting-associated protein 54 n=1 Tax=Microdochium bolleyi TaxID=196109 RepID=A0A136J7T1_9PEZI|nr:Vps54-like protein-domain-containing protein [Microdochium bolleyi]